MRLKAKKERERSIELTDGRKERKKIRQDQKVMKANVVGAVFFCPTK